MWLFTGADCIEITVWNFDMNTTYSHELQALDFQRAFQELKEKILMGTDSERSSVGQRLNYLEQLSQFDLGRYLIVNKGMNGFWTHCVCTFPMEQTPLKTALESFMFSSRPMALATQERLSFFLKIGQGQVQEVEKGLALQSSEHSKTIRPSVRALTKPILL